MEILQQFLPELISPTSIWSVVARGVLWFVIATIIIISSDKPDPRKPFASLKTNLGFFLFFLVLSSGLIYLLFGFTKA